MAAPFHISVIEPWIDYNGHLNEGYFGVIFGHASDDLLEQLGFDETYRVVERGTFYTVETHIRFLNELALGDELRIEMRILGLDEKRVHLWHEMYRDHDGTLAASQESMLLHVDVDEVRVRPMTNALYAAALAELTGGHAEFPPHAGRAIGVLQPPAAGTTA